MATLLLIAPVIGASWLLTFLLRDWARRRMIDVPNERSSHRRPTPRGGGLPIALLASAAAAWTLRDAAISLPVACFLIGGLLIAAVGWIDDLRSLPNRTRFACQLAGAILVLLALGYAAPAAPGGLTWWLLGLPAIAWIVGLTNLYNFMDGIDGLAGGQALVAAAWWAAVALDRDLPEIAILATTIGGASAGFLLHNWSPASIFMGDVGSTFLGYTFAVLPLFSLALGDDWAIALGGLLAVWPFLFDGTLTILRRLLRGENIFRAHRSHLYQRLVINGYSHATVSGLYIAYAAVCALCGFALTRGNAWALLALPPALGLVLFLWVSGVERRANRRLATP